jgi:hypothetical protein
MLPENGLAIRIYLAEAYRLVASDHACSQGKAADTAEQIEVSQHSYHRHGIGEDLPIQTHRGHDLDPGKRCVIPR